MQTISKKIIGLENEGLSNYSSGCFEIKFKSGEHLIFNEYDLIECSTDETLFGLLKSVAWELEERSRTSKVRLVVPEGNDARKEKV